MDPKLWEVIDDYKDNLVRDWRDEKKTSYTLGLHFRFFHGSQ